MPKNETSAVAEFLKGEEKEKSFFEPEKEELFSEEKAEEKKEEEVVDEKPLPFHKDPKVQRYVEKQIAKALEGVSTKSETQKFIQEVKGEESSELMDALTAVIGNDSPEKLRVLKAFEKRMGDIEIKASERAVQEFKAQAEAQVKEDQRAQKELDEAFESIEETYNVDLSSSSPVARKMRSDFVDFVRRIAPKDASGEVIAFPDMSSAFEEFQERTKRPAGNSRAKELASRSMSRSSDASVQPTGGKTWKDVDKMINSLN